MQPADPKDLEFEVGYIISVHAWSFLEVYNTGLPLHS